MQPGFDERHRNQTSEISKNTARRLWVRFGPSTARTLLLAFPALTPWDVLTSSPDHASLSQMRHDHDAGKLKRNAPSTGMAQPVKTARKTVAVATALSAAGTERRRGTLQSKPVRSGV
jgi:hypothetical protein